MPQARPTPTTQVQHRALNLVVLLGRLSSDEVRRTLPSGDLLCQFEVTVPATSGEAASATTTPVVLFGTRKGAIGQAGDEVLVIGSVRRRFFRAGGSTQSRTEVVASKLLLAPQKRSLRSAHKAALAELGVLTDDQVDDAA